MIIHHHSCSFIGSSSHSDGVVWMCKDMALRRVASCGVGPCIVLGYGVTEDDARCEVGALQGCGCRSGDFIILLEKEEEG